MNNWDITQGIGYAIMNLGRLMGRNVNQHIATINDDVTMQQGAMLYFIARSKDGELIQQDIAQLMDINKSATLRTIDILEKKGFVKRHAVENDRRKNRLEVTPQGTEVINAFAQCVMEKEQAIRKDLTSTEIEAFFKVAAKLREKLAAG